MKTRMAQCTILYETWQMQCCGDPIQVGQIVSLPCIKKGPYTSACGINIDFDEEHHNEDANCLIRGKVTEIRSVFVDSYANGKSDTRLVDDPNNTFAVIEVEYIDGWEEPDCYEHRKGDNPCFYIITLENAVECVLDSCNLPLNQGAYVNIAPDDDSKTLFCDEEGSEIGTVDDLTIYKDEKSQKIDLTAYSWHNDLLAWHKFFQANIHDGYKNVDNTEWLKWWAKGWALAKEIRELLPLDIGLTYGHRSQSVQVINGDDLNTESFRIYLPKHMQNRIDEGLYIPKAHVNSETKDDESLNYMFKLNESEHNIHPNDRVMLGVSDRKQYQTGTVIQCSTNELLIHTNWPLDMAEYYSIELIV